MWAMRELILRLAPVLRLTRVSGAFAAVGNVWFVVLWCHYHREHETWSVAMQNEPLWLLLAGGALAAAALYAFSSTVNDVVDASRDRALRRSRPLVEGDASGETAIFAAAGTLILSVLGATVFGTAAVVATLVLAGLILGYHAAGKFVPGVGLVLLAVVYAGHMLAPNLGLRFVLPVWLVMTHALAVAWLAHRLGRKSPPLSGRAVTISICGWVAASAALAVIAVRRGGVLPEWVTPTAVIFPGLLVLLYAGMVTRRVLQLGPGPRLGSKIERYGALWLPIYACAWLWGVGDTTGTAIMGVVVVAGLLGMTVLRELYGLAEHPVGYRV